MIGEIIDSAASVGPININTNTNTNTNINTNIKQ